MSDTTDRPDWRSMKPGDFTGRRPKAPQAGRGLFSADELDAGGTDPLFGVDLWDDAPGAAAAPTDPEPLPGLADVPITGLE
ncbi:hypothetical protein [Streptomyces sp. NPDC026673]|uniref:hypothetical protein n=1 Tax=Streptomyces sp. NPDC026673 TaxID=3155724 RepID=UPI0033D25754